MATRRDLSLRLAEWESRLGHVGRLLNRLPPGLPPADVDRLFDDFLAVDAAVSEAASCLRRRKPRVARATEVLEGRCVVAAPSGEAVGFLTEAPAALTIREAVVDMDVRYRALTGLPAADYGAVRRAAGRAARAPVVAPTANGAPNPMAGLRDLARRVVSSRHKRWVAELSTPLPPTLARPPVVAGRKRTQEQEYRDWVLGVRKRWR